MSEIRTGRISGSPSKTILIESPLAGKSTGSGSRSGVPTRTSTGLHTRIYCILIRAVWNILPRRW